MPNTPLGRRSRSRAHRLSLQLAAALLIALAAACGGGDDEEEVVEPEPTPTQAPIPTATPLAATPAPTIIGGDATVAPEPTPRTEVTYRVVPGDTLSAIAQRFGTTVQALMAVNDIADPTLIFAGQDLTIPGEGEATAEPAGDGGDDADDAGDGDEVDGVSSYVVQPGDTASAIAGRFGVTLAALAEANETTIEELAVIFVGQELALPRPP